MKFPLRPRNYTIYLCGTNWPELVRTSTNWFQSANVKVEFKDCSAAPTRQGLYRFETKVFFGKGLVIYKEVYFCFIGIPVVFFFSSEMALDAGNRRYLWKHPTASRG